MATTTAATTAFAILALPSEDKFWFVHKFCEDIAHGKGKGDKDEYLLNHFHVCHFTLKFEMQQEQRYRQFLSL